MFRRVAQGGNAGGVRPSYATERYWPPREADLARMPPPLSLGLSRAIRHWLRYDAVRAHYAEVISEGTRSPAVEAFLRAIEFFWRLPSARMGPSGAPPWQSEILSGSCGAETGPCRALSLNLGWWGEAPRHPSAIFPVTTGTSQRTGHGAAGGGADNGAGH
jgi:hypothetical protein